MNMKKLVAAAALALMVVGTQAGAETLRVGSETVYPPFEFLDSNSGKYVGFDIDLIDEVAKRAGFEPQILSMGLDGLIPALMSGSIDVAVSALTITPERAAKVDFTKPYYESGLSIMARKDDASIKGVKDLENKVLCAEIGSSGSVFMSKIKGAKIRTFNSAGEAFLELNNKGCEAIVNDKPVNEYFLTQKASANLNLREVPGVLKAENYGFAIRKGDDKLRARLDKVLDEIRADGTTTRSTPSGSAATSELLSESKAPADGFIRRALGLLVTLFRKVTGQLLRPWDWLLRKDRPDGRSRGNPSRRKLRFEPHHECRPRIHRLQKDRGSAYPFQRRERLSQR